jgi:hypothetical protein
LLTLVAVALAAGAALTAQGRAAADPARILVRPNDDGRALVNPGMGWVLHHYDNSLEQYGSRLALSDALDDFPGLSTAYLRLAWSYLEPEEGLFRREIVDSPAQRWIAQGKKVALRFSASEGERGVGTPLWVKAAGARGYLFESGQGVVAEVPDRPWEPDFDDPVFLERLECFVAAAAARYDGDPHVAFVKVSAQGRVKAWGRMRGRHVRLSSRPDCAHGADLKRGWPEAARRAEAGGSGICTSTRATNSIASILSASVGSDPSCPALGT